MGGFGGGSLEHPRHRLGVQWHRILPGSTELPRAAVEVVQRPPCAAQRTLPGVPRGGAGAELGHCPGGGRHFDHAAAPPSLKQMRQTASAGTSRAARPPCAEAAPAAGAAVAPTGAASSFAARGRAEGAAAAEEAAVEAAGCSLVEPAVAPALTGRWLTAARFPSGPLAARMTTTGQSTTPSDASDASSSCGRWSGLG